MCRARGRLKEKGLQLLVGDFVEVGEIVDGRGVIESVLPRRNRLTRPPVANVDLAIIVFSVKEPPLALFFLDRIVLTAEKAGLGIFICFTKTDLLKADGLDSFLGIAETYRACGYKVFFTSTKTGQGFQEIKLSLKGKVSALAGPSGVGKTSLINQLKPGLGLLSSPVSKKGKRGRQTTRDVSLIRLDRDTFIVDTPGFQRLDLEGFIPQDLADFFPEIRALGDHCRFGGCQHVAEPGCAVKEALKESKIASWRYEHYRSFLKEIKQKNVFSPKGEKK
ncbi:MAG TPA: ribosome small subunit-dependent GTPase A [Firmicutes bacterium]|nr:ribosome small subunit-dependent GTPase A [Bacillota bacterium]